MTNELLAELDRVRAKLFDTTTALNRERVERVRDALSLRKQLDREHAARKRAQEVLEEVWAELCPSDCPLCGVSWRQEPPHTADCELVAVRKEPE